jgi:hypothetical protein
MYKSFASLITILSQLCFASLLLAECPAGYTPAALLDYPELAACLCETQEVTCIDDVEAPEDYLLCSDAPACDAFDDSDDEDSDLPDDGSDQEVPLCGAFSYGTLIDYLSWQEEDYGSFIRGARPLFNGNKDFWVTRGIEDPDAEAQMQAAVEALLSPTFEDDDDSDMEDPDYEEPAMLCYSIEDLLINLSETACTKPEKRVFDSIYPRLKKALAASGPFVANELESAEDAAALRELLESVASTCLTRKALLKKRKEEQKKRRNQRKH